MDKISIINETDHQVNEELINKLVALVLKAESKAQVELNIIMVDNPFITDLNVKYRHKEGPTDVITFAFNDTPSIIEYEYELLGEIYVSIDQAIIQAKEYDHSIDREIGFLVVHGMYHLLGFDHQDEADTKLMRQKEESILNGCKETQR